MDSPVVVLGLGEYFVGGKKPSAATTSTHNAAQETQATANAGQERQAARLRQRHGHGVEE